VEFGEVLKLLRKAQAGVRLKATLWYELDLVFADQLGLPFKIQQVERDFAKARALAGLRDEVRLYDLRHTMASLLLYLGKSLKLIAARLGHSSETLVLTTYGHLQPTDDRDVAEELWEVTRCGRGGPCLRSYVRASPPKLNSKLAERVGFEPTMPLRA
jgi:integrase